MKFFDYKFLIILGLSLVVYFIYREVEILRTKVYKLENEIKNNKLIEPPTIQPIQNKQEITENINKPIEHNKISPKIINIEIDKTPGVKINSEIVSKEENEKAHTFDETSSESSDDSSTTTDLEDEDSESSKHLAIYSNDNEQIEETQNSLLESVESAKNNRNFCYDDKIMENMEPNVNDIMESITTPESPIKIISENKKLSEVDKNIELNEELLDKMKLPEIKKIAEDKNISLTKKVNGQQKPKNKQELIHDIINIK